MVITFSNIKGSTGGGGATGGTVSGITLWSDETTKAYIDNALSGVTDVLSAYTKTEDFATINGSAITSGGNIVVEATPYTAGTNIDITDHIISVTGITLPTKVSELVNDEGYITTADTQNFVTSGDVQTQINDSISGKADSSAVTAQISEVKAQIEAEIPTKVSSLENDLNFASTGDVESMISGFTTSADVKTQIEGYNYINSEQAQAQIDNSISGKVDTNVFNAYTANTKTEIDNAVSVKADSSRVDEIEEVTASALVELHSTKQDILVSGTNIKTINNQSLLGSGNIEIQGGGETYSAGEGIGIDVDNIISVTGNYETIVELTQAEYDALTSYDKNTTYVITDAPAVNLSAYTPTSGFSTINGNVITDGGNIVIEGGNTYTAGANIDISTDNVISVTGITMPTKLSELTNDEGFVNSGEVETQITNKDYSTKNWVQDQVNLAIESETARTELTYAKIGDIPSLDGYATTGWVESQGYITGYTETDPVFQASAASGITSHDITNWNAKLDSSDLEPYYTSAQTDNAISNAVSGKADSSAVTTQISEVKAQIEAEIPSKVSSLENDLNFVNSGDVKTQVESYNYINSGQAQTQIDNSISGKLDTDIFTTYTANTQTELNNKQDASAMTAYATTAFTENTYAKIGDIPTKTSDLTNDSGFITDAALSGYATEQYVDNSVSGKVDNSALTQYYTSAQTDTAISNAVSEKLDTSAITAYSTTEEVENMITAATNGLASEEWVESQGYLKEHQSLSAYSTTEQMNQAIGSATAATTGWVESQGYLTEHQSLSAYSTTEQVQTLINTAKQEVENEIPDISNFVTSAQVETQITSKGYLTGYTETDPVFMASPASGITSQDITNWNAKLDSSALTPYYTSAQTDNAISNAVSVKADSSRVDEIEEVTASALVELHSTKQDILVSGTNIKTINNQSLLGSGNIEIQGGSGSDYSAGTNIDITNNVISVTGITIPTSNTAFTNDAGYITSGEVESQITGKNYATENWVQDNINLAIESETARTESTYAKIGDIPSLDGYATTGWVESQGYLKEHQDISGKLDSNVFTAYTANTQTELSNKQDASAMTAYATTAFTESTYLKEHQSLSAYSTTEQVQTLINTAKQEVENEIPDVSNFVTSAQVNTQIESKGYITGYTESDPVFQASAASGISAQDINNWNNKLDSSALNPYYTSAQTNTAISNAVSGKTDKVSVTASGSGYKFPKWNNQGCITGTSATAYQAFHNINGSSRKVYSDSSEALPTIYAPTSEGLAGQPLLSNGSGAPVWGAYKFQFISQSQYDALATKDSTTIYFIVNEN